MARAEGDSSLRRSWAFWNSGGGQLMDKVADDLIYDVGMHKGEDTAYYLAKGYRVVAFEAHPGLAAQARERFADAIDDGRLEIIEGAITPCGEKTAVLFVHSTASEWGTIDVNWVQRNKELLGESTPVTVGRIDLAEVLRRTGVPLYMKVDIEGADQACFASLAEFSARPRYVSLESSKNSLRDVEAEFAMLERLGYDRFAVVQQASIGGKAIETTTRDGSPMRYKFESAASGPFGGDLRRWTDRVRALRAYRLIFVAYAVLGDRSLLRRTRIGNRALSRLTAYVPLPGWYDTHARLGTHAAGAIGEEAARSHAQGAGAEPDEFGC